MIQAFIFDLDGVIVDTARYHFLAWRRLANELGFDFDEVRNEELKGVGRLESLQLILQWGGISLSEQEQQDQATRKNTWYREYITKMDETEILSGVLDFLDAAEAAGLQLAVGSGSKNATTILERIGLKDRFATIVDGNRLTKSKPDPQVFELAAQDISRLPAECVVFEDAAKGIDAALAGGFWTVGVGDKAVLGHAHTVIAGFMGKTPTRILAKMEGNKPD